MISIASFENIKEIISLDPYDIKKSLIDLIDKNLGTKNPDTYEAGFLGYLTQAQTLLTSDILFNNSMAWNEAFTHLLTLPTSLQNHANMFDYKLSHATPCSGFITIYIPFPTDAAAYQLTLKNGTACEGPIPYLVKDTYLINVSMTPKVQKKNAVTGVVSDIDINVEIKDGNRYLIFNAEVWQIRIFTYSERFTNVVYKEFYDINIGGIEDQFHSIVIGCYMKDDNLSDARLVRFEQIPSIYSATSKDKVYTFKYFGNGRGTIRYGNGVFGLQPKEGSTTSILVYTTKGKDGLAHPGQIQLDTRLIDYYSNTPIDIYGTNVTIIDNGYNEESLERAKANIIAHTSAARRLVTKDDYIGYEGVTGIKNLELYPMLLRRDTNVNEIDLFSVIYDENGAPVPTTNLNYIINDDRTILSKDYVYKLAMKHGNNGVELVPNTMKIVNSNAIDPDKHELYAAMYIDSEYDNYDPLYDSHDKKIIYIYSDNVEVYVNPDEVKEFVCPFNISIEKREGNRVGIFEYIPHNLVGRPKIEDSIDYVDIDISLSSALLEFLPNESMYRSNIKPTHVNVINNLIISSNVSTDLFKSYVVISQEGKPAKRYQCEHKYISSETNEMSTTCMIPIQDFYPGEFLYEYVVYYGAKYYNTYKKYITIINDFDLSLTDKYIGYPLSFAYDPSDPRSMQTQPAIDKVYVGITKVDVQWTKWKDSNGFNVDGYIVDVILNKLQIVDVNKVQCRLFIGTGGNSYDIDSIASFNDTMVTYRFKVPYNPKFIMNGNTYYKVQILYKFNDNSGAPSNIFSPFASYSGFIIFRRRFSELMWCNIEKIENQTNTAYKIYRIPVIDKQYYDSHIEYLENNIFYQLAQIDSKTIDYKMLTDTMNFKFAKTIGATENLKYNDRVHKIDESLKYGNWTCDLPPTIRLQILITRNTTRNKNDIVNECKQVILSFLQLKANFNAKIIMSEVTRYIHDTIPEILSCKVISPNRDIIYMFDESHLPKDKDTLLSYNPEFLWIDASKIRIDTVIAPM